MATWFPISGVLAQRVLSSGLPASGYVLKLYAEGTSTNIPIATDSSGATQANYAVYNSLGDLTVSGNTIIPHINQNYKLCVYPTQAAADADSGATVSIDYIQVDTGSGSFTANDSSNTSVTNVLTLTHNTTGTPGNGIGTGIEFKTETYPSNTETGSIIESVTTDTTLGSEDFDLVFKNMAAGAAAAEVARFKSTGSFVPAGPIEAKTGASIASASTVNLDAATGNRVHITGTTTITAVTLTKGPRTVIFDGALTLTHHATNNNLPYAANITTAAGDRAIYESDGTTVYCVGYIRYSNPIPPNEGGTGQTTYTNGQLLIGNTTGNTLTKATLTAGSGITITNGTGSITIASSGGSITRTARTSNTILGVSDTGKLIDITSGTFSQTFTAAATLGSGWSVYIRNSGTGDITLDPDGSETIDGLTTYIMYPGECRLVLCTGTAFFTVVISPFIKNYTSSDTFTKPPGYTYFGTQTRAPGGGGARPATADNGGGGGGGGGNFRKLILATSVGTTETVTIGAAGAGATSNYTNGSAGGTSSFGSLISVVGGTGGNRDSYNVAGGPPLGGYAAGTTATLDVNGASVDGGGAGASGGNGTTIFAGGCSVNGGGGGGGGGRAPANQAGGAGGASGGSASVTPGGGGNGGASGVNGTAGTNGSGGGGGGGVSGGTGGAGGAGGFPGGGGGGGGSGATSGNGGAGGAGDFTIWGIA
jgi:hypothetical protein